MLDGEKKIERESLSVKLKSVFDSATIIALNHSNRLIERNRDAQSSQKNQMSLLMMINQLVIFIFS